jgi:hypothetical protein
MIGVARALSDRDCGALQSEMRQAQGEYLAGVLSTMIADRLPPCDDCDGEGNIWNNADPTSGQRVDCACLSIPVAIKRLEARIHLWADTSEMKRDIQVLIAALRALALTESEK